MADIAVLGCRGSNIGDAVQAYALLGLLGRPVDVIVDREGVSTFRPESETVLVVNGWLKERPEDFQFADGVTPVFVGVHLSGTRPSQTHFASLADCFTYSPSFQSVMRAAAPIGCRDLYTLGLMQAAGVESYFSSCVTLCLESRNVAKQDFVLAIDVSEEFVDIMREKTRRPVLVSTNQQSGSWLRPDGVARSVDSYLDLIASSHLVVTSRLHAALPAVAMGVPVIFAPRDPKDARFSGLTDFLPVVFPEENLRWIPPVALDEPAISGLREPTTELRTAREHLAFALGGGVERVSPWASPLAVTELDRACLAFEREHYRSRLTESLLAQQESADELAGMRNQRDELLRELEQTRGWLEGLRRVSSWRRLLTGRPH